MMAPIKARIFQDIEKIKQLSEITSKKVNIIKIEGNPPNHIEIELKYPTYSASGDTTVRRQPNSIIQIDLLDRYPFLPPKVYFKTPIFHPNVYINGLLCLGSHWEATEFLDLLVKRIVKIICFDPEYTNPKSPANIKAVTWYLEKLKTNPKLFPTIDLSHEFPEVAIKPKIIFRNISK